MGWLTKKEYEKTFSVIYDILSEYEIRCSCNNIFKPKNLEHSYDIHDNTYWIYASCPICLYDCNYQKILKQCEDIKGGM